MNKIQVLVNSAKIALTPKSSIAQKNEELFNSASLRPERIVEIDTVLAKLNPGQLRYRSVANEVNSSMPWWFILMVHAMEAGHFQYPFRYHLHCGDPLTGRTFHVPAGMPKFNPGKGNNPPSIQNPYTWEESAADALILTGCHKEKDWSLGNILYKFEKFNGLGSRKRGINTPYVWSFTSHYGTPPNTGKYVADRVWDKNAISKQPGCAAYLLRLIQTGVISF